MRVGMSGGQEKERKGVQVGKYRRKRGMDPPSEEEVQRQSYRRSWRGAGQEPQPESHCLGRCLRSERSLDAAPGTPAGSVG